MGGVSFQKASTETFSFTLYMLRNYTKSQVPMTPAELAKSVGHKSITIDSLDQMNFQSQHILRGQAPQACCRVSQGSLSSPSSSGINPSSDYTPGSGSDRSLCALPWELCTLWSSQLPVGRVQDSEPRGGKQSESFTYTRQLTGVWARTQTLCLSHTLTVEVLDLYLFHG